jgi:hypothetical protein
MNNNDTPQTTNQPAAAGKLRKLFKPRDGRARLAIALLALVIVVAGAWLLARNPNSTNYEYQKLDSFTLPGFYKNAGITFKKPVELQPVLKVVDGQQANILVHNKTLANKHVVTLSYMGAASSFNTMFLPRTQSDYDNAQAGLTNPSSKQASYYRGNVSTFINQNLNKRWTITLGDGRPLKTANLQHAWEVDFTGVDKNPKGSYVPTKLKGEAVFAIGKGAFYYFMESAVNNNLDKNKAVWQQVTDSLKIDQ